MCQTQGGAIPCRNPLRNREIVQAGIGPKIPGEAKIWLSPRRESLKAGRFHYSPEILGPILS